MQEPVSVRNLENLPRVASSLLRIGKLREGWDEDIAGGELAYADHTIVLTRKFLALFSGSLRSALGEESHLLPNATCRFSIYPGSEGIILLHWNHRWLELLVIIYPNGSLACHGDRGRDDPNRNAITLNVPNQGEARSTEASQKFVEGVNSIAVWMAGILNEAI